METKRNLIEENKKPSTVIQKIIWIMIGLLSIINLYVLFYHFLIVATPNFYVLFKKYEIVGYLVLAIMVVLVNTVMKNLLQKNVGIFLGFNCLVLIINILAFRNIWLGL